MLYLLSFFTCLLETSFFSKGDFGLPIEYNPQSRLLYPAHGKYQRGYSGKPFDGFQGGILRASRPGPGTAELTVSRKTERNTITSFIRKAKMRFRQDQGMDCRVHDGIESAIRHIEAFLCVSKEGRISSAPSVDWPNQ